MTLKRNWPFFLLWLTLLGAYLSGIFENEAVFSIILGDGQGYYGYLVALFIEQSFDWETVIRACTANYPEGNWAEFTVQTESGLINKYFVGTSVLMLPSFLVALVYSWFAGFPLDGYSMPFQNAMAIGAMTYAAVGAAFLNDFLMKKGFSRTISGVASVSSVLATGVFYYSFCEPAMSHVYSYFLFCAFIWSVHRLFAQPGRLRFMVSSLLFGLIVLVRPSNGLVLFSVPFIVGGLEPVVTLMKRNEFFKWFGYGFVLIVGLLLLQFMMYVLQVGKLMVWSYKNEGFNFLDPELINVLFSFKKGFFIYTPWALLGTLGAVIYLMKEPRKGAWLWFFLGLSVYVISCWWNWYYGGSFGMRALIEYTPFFAFGLAYLMQAGGVLVSTGVSALILFACYLNGVQSYQYTKFILHWDNMNKDRYLKVFLETERKYDGIFYSEDRLIQLKSRVEELVARPNAKTAYSYSTDFEKDVRNPALDSMEVACHSGKNCNLIDQKNNYGHTIERPLSELGQEGTFILHYSMMVWSEEELPDLTLAFSYRKEEMQDYGHEYVSMRAMVVDSERWTKVEDIIELPPPESMEHSIVIYPFTNNAKRILIDDLNYEFITVSD